MKNHLNIVKQACNSLLLKLQGLNLRCLQNTSHSTLLLYQVWFRRGVNSHNPCGSGWISMVGEMIMINVGQNDQVIQCVLSVTAGNLIRTATWLYYCMFASDAVMLRFSESCWCS